MSRSKAHPKFRAQKPRYFFREWRKFRGHTQAELAELMGVSVATVSQIETGKVGFSDTTLEAFAGALNCQPGDLLLRNPSDQEQVWQIWNHIPEEKRSDALRLLSVLADQSSEKPSETAQRKTGTR